jgi:hypothetical protein
MNIKTIQVDFSSSEDILKCINVLKSRLAQLKQDSDPTFVSRNEKVRRTFVACQSIMDTDISSLYKDIDLDLTPKYYVYAHCDTGFKIALKKNGKTTFGATLGIEYVPFYIGKGTGDRAFELNRNESHRKVRQKLQRFGKDASVKIIKDNLTELEALCFESKLIDIFGLISQRNGHLVNLDEGVRAAERRMLYRDQLAEISSLNKNSLIVEAKGQDGK